MEIIYYVAIDTRIGMRIIGKIDLGIWGHAVLNFMNAVEDVREQVQAEICTTIRTAVRGELEKHNSDIHKILSL